MDKINLGIRAHDIEAQTIEELALKLQQKGLSNIQFAPMKSFPTDFANENCLSPGLAHYYGDKFKKAEVTISVLGCYVNIIDSDWEKRQAALKKFATYTSYASQFGACLIATETGSVGNGYTVDNFTEEAYQKVVVSVKKMVAIAENCGVLVGIEPGMNHPIHTVEKLRRLVDDVASPNLKVILDVANLISPDNYLKQDEIMTDAFEQLADVIAGIHFKDFQVDNQQLKIVPVGQGILNYDLYLRQILTLKPHIFCSFEGIKEKDYEASKAYLEGKINEIGD